MTDSIFQRILDKNAQSKPMQRATVKRIKPSPNEAIAKRALEEIRKVIKG